MMGTHHKQPQLFSYAVRLEERIRPDHPLRRINAILDLSFVRPAVAPFYGSNGNVSVDPEILIKLMLLLFLDDIPSERELMERLPERLDYLWFLGYTLEDPVPHHSVLSKARARWGKEVFQTLFVQTVRQCVEAGLVGGSKIHVDSTLIDANASKKSTLVGPPELIQALKQTYGAVETKLAEVSREPEVIELVPGPPVVTTPESYEAVSERTVSTTDPDSTLARKDGATVRPRYHHHRVVDDACGVITAIETTTGVVAENQRLMPLIDQHRANTHRSPAVVVGDHKYGTVTNFVACQQQGVVTHLGDLLSRQATTRQEGIFSESQFRYEGDKDVFVCPAGREMKPRRTHPVRGTAEYVTAPGTCQQCALRAQCTRSKTGRTVHRHPEQELLNRARRQAHSAAARRDRRRRQELMERSFADGANNHGLKRSRWRRLWRQQIQDGLIAAVQNLRLLVRWGAGSGPRGVVAANGALGAMETHCVAFRVWKGWKRHRRRDELPRHVLGREVRPTRGGWSRPRSECAFRQHAL